MEGYHSHHQGVEVQQYLPKIWATRATIFHPIYMINLTLHKRLPQRHRNTTVFAQVMGYQGYHQGVEIQQYLPNIWATRATRATIFHMINLTQHKSLLQRHINTTVFAQDMGYHSYQAYHISLAIT